MHDFRPASLHQMRRVSLHAREKDAYDTLSLPEVLNSGMKGQILRTERGYGHYVMNTYDIHIMRQ
jgi:hypothetical protein